MSLRQLSATSEERLKGVHEGIVHLVRVINDYYPIEVIEGVRSVERQKELMALGKTKTMDSKHIKGHAVDIAPKPIDWNNQKRFYFMAGVAEVVAKDLGLNIRWGGDWDGDKDFSDQTFNDLVHFELG